MRSGGHALRLLDAFDHARQAVLLVGGDKTGDGRFYERLVTLAEGEWAVYLDSTGRRVK